MKRLGPGLIPSAADDDPSGIPTYTQAGAQFGFGILWTMLLAYPLMVAIQSLSARLGRVTARGTRDKSPPSPSGAHPLCRRNRAARREYDQYRRRSCSYGC